MADFSQAFAKTMVNEGGYSNDSADRGGETYRGISRVFFPNWSGWPIVDGWKQSGSPPSSLDGNANLQGQVAAFYRVQFWNRVDGDQIANQDLANKLFDMAVNMGVGQAVKILQEMLNVVFDANLTVDGGFGSKSLAAITGLNLTQQATLLNAIRVDQGNFYLQLVRNNASQRVFIGGWLRRAMG